MVTKKFVAFRANPEYVERVNVLANKQNRTASYIYNLLLEQYLEDLEDIFECDKALAEFKASGERAIPAEEVWKELGV